jgi:hypothetical protein
VCTFVCASLSMLPCPIPFDGTNPSSTSTTTSSPHHLSHYNRTLTDEGMGMLGRHGGPGIRLNIHRTTSQTMLPDPAWAAIRLPGSGGNVSHDSVLTDGAHGGVSVAESLSEEKKRKHRCAT